MSNSHANHSAIESQGEIPDNRQMRKLK